MGEKTFSDAPSRKAARIKGGAPIPLLPDVDFRARAIDFHRRAQQAEAAAARAAQDAAYWRAA